jgi:hypothetical protein
VIEKWRDEGEANVADILRQSGGKYSRKVLNKNPNDRKHDRNSIILAKQILLQKVSTKLGTE